MQGLGCEALDYRGVARQLRPLRARSIGAPALVICRSEEVWLSAGNSRYLAHEIPDS